MGREKKAGPGTAAGHHAKERHKRDKKGAVLDWSGPVPKGLVAKPKAHQHKSRHHTYLEFVENTEKKKKLEFQITTNKAPPPGFEFVPIGNPALTTACKELSREQDAMIFIVSAARDDGAKELTLALNRVGHHIRQTIVEQARASLGDLEFASFAADHGVPEPIPEDQEEINRQADSAIKDLFPRIPNADRETIIQHAFRRGAKKKGIPLVGLAPDITLSRRVQLAVLAHIRHTHTRYDELLRETTYVNARKVVESLCLDILVKWRGDEETGRDQLDEILREVVVISDSDGEEDEDDESGSTEDSSIPEPPPAKPRGPAAAVASPQEPPNLQNTTAATHTLRLDDRAVQVPESRRLAAKASKKDRKAAKKAQRGFLRYQAVRDQAWHEAVERQRMDVHKPASPAAQMPPREPASNVSQTRNTRPGSYSYPAYDTEMPYDGHEYLVRNDNRRTAVALRPLHPSVDDRTSETENITRFGPAAGPRANPPESSPAPPAAVSYRDEHLRDCLVQSIEQKSPGTPHFPYQASRPRFSGPQHPEHISSRLAVPETQPGVRNVAPGLYYEEFPHSRHMADDERHYRSIAAGRGSDTIPTSSVGYSESRAPRSYFGGSSVVYPVAGPFDAVRRQSPSTYPRSPAIAQDGGFLRQESRPIVVEDLRFPTTPRQRSHPYPPGGRDSQHSAVLGEELRPVVVDNYRARPERREVFVREPYSAQLERTREAEPEFVELRRQPADRPIHQPRAYGDSPIDSPRMDWAPEMRARSHMPVEFIPVSNMFPRPHAPPPTTRDGYWRSPDDPAVHVRRRERPEDSSRYHLGAHTSLPGEERVVRVQYPDHGYQDFVDEEHRIQAEQRALRRDGVIYIG